MGKTAVLKPEAKDGEVTVVQVECEGYNSQEVAVPICAMKGGADLQRYLDVLIPSPPATLKIVRGEGPIHLIPRTKMMAMRRWKLRKRPRRRKLRRTLRHLKMIRKLLQQSKVQRRRKLQ